jgi:hypothetical protein
LFIRAKSISGDSRDKAGEAGWSHCFPGDPFYPEGGGSMQETEVKRIKSKAKKARAVARDASMKGGARGGDEAATAKASENQEPPIIQRYSE